MNRFLSSTLIALICLQAAFALGQERQPPAQQPVPPGAEPLAQTPEDRDEAPLRLRFLRRLGLGANPNRQGIIFDRIDRDSAFERAGLQPGDTLLEIDGRPVAGPLDLLDAIDLDRPMNVTVQREGRRQTFDVDVPQYRRFFEELSQEFGADRARPTGYGRDAARSLGIVLEADPTRGAVVAEVLPNSPAEASGLRPGDRLVRLNGRDIRGRNALTAAIAAIGPGQTAELEFERPERKSAQIRIEQLPDRAPERPDSAAPPRS